MAVSGSVRLSTTEDVPITIFCRITVGSIIHTCERREDNSVCACTNSYRQRMCARVSREVHGHRHNVLRHPLAPGIRETTGRGIGDVVADLRLIRVDLHADGQWSIWPKRVERG